MARALILRALGAGALGGLVAFIFARIFAEPLIQAAIDYESARDEAKDALAVAAGQTPEAAGPDIFSRAIQGNLGIGVGMIFFGVAIGCLFGVAYCLAYGRLGALTPRQLSLRVALFGFLTMYLVPFLKYPANPPSVGNPDTIGPRSGLYLIMVVASVVFAVGAVWLGRRLLPRLGSLNATVVAGLAFVVLIGIVMALLPQLGSLAANAGQTGASLTETPQPLLDPAGHIVFPGFDPDLMFRFRLYSVGAQVLLWGVMGVVFGVLAERVVGRTTPEQQAEFAAAT
jgi:hypothetical protein